MVLLHIGAGASFLVFGLPWAGRLLRGCSTAEKAGWIVFLLGGTAGGVILSPARRGMWPVLYTHELVSALASAILLSVWAGSLAAGPKPSVSKYTGPAAPSTS